MTDGTTSRPLILDHEKLYDHVDQMTDVKKVELEGVTTYSGSHPDLGFIHVIVPMIGKGLVFAFSVVVTAAECASLVLPPDFLMIV